MAAFPRASWRSTRRLRNEGAGLGPTIAPATFEQGAKPSNQAAHQAYPGYMGQELVTREVDLSPDVTGGLSPDQWPGDLPAVVILPDRVGDIGGVVYAAYLPETQGLRACLLEAGLTVHLATPPNAKNVTYEEHDASWVLPVVLAVGQLPIAVVAQLVANWLQVRLYEAEVPTQVRYREGRLEPDGTLRVVEIEGPSDQVVRTLRARPKE